MCFLSLFLLFSFYQFNLTFFSFFGRWFIIKKLCKFQIWSPPRSPHPRKVSYEDSNPFLLFQFWMCFPVFRGFTGSDASASLGFWDLIFSRKCGFSRETSPSFLTSCFPTLRGVSRTKIWRGIFGPLIPGRKSAFSRENSHLHSAIFYLSNISEEPLHAGRKTKFLIL